MSKRRKRHSPEQIVRRLCDADAIVADCRNLLVKRAHLNIAPPDPVNGLGSVEARVAEAMRDSMPGLLGWHVVHAMRLAVHAW